MTLTGHWLPMPSCCGLSLRNGVIWIAEICTVVGIALVIFSGFAIDEVVWHWQYREAPFVAAMHGIALVLGLVQTATSLLLWIGALRERPLLMRPWLIFYTVQTILLLLATFAISVVIIIYVEPVPVGITLFLVCITYVYAFRYFILVVYSYYRQLHVVTPGAASSTVQLA